MKPHNKLVEHCKQARTNFLGKERIQPIKKSAENKMDAVASPSVPKQTTENVPEDKSEETKKGGKPSSSWFGNKFEGLKNKLAGSKSKDDPMQPPKDFKHVQEMTDMPAEPSCQATTTVEQKYLLMIQPLPSQADDLVR